MNEIAMILSAFENRLSAGVVCKQIQPLSRIKTLNGQRVRRISPVGKEKVYGVFYIRRVVSLRLGASV